MFGLWEPEKDCIKQGWAGGRDGLVYSALNRQNKSPIALAPNYNCSFKIMHAPSQQLQGPAWAVHLSTKGAAALQVHAPSPLGACGTSRPACSQSNGHKRV